MLVVELIEGYLDSLNTLDTAARRASDTPYLRWWIGHVGGLHAAALTLDRIRTGLSAVMQDGRTPGAARHFLRALRRACAWGVTTGHLSVDPCRQVPIPKDQPRPIRALSVDEERALCDALGEPYASWVRIAVLTGLRQSEQFMLRWNDVHLGRAVLTVPSPSTGAVAEVALSLEAVTLFRGLRAQTESRWVFPDPKNLRQPVDPHRIRLRAAAIVQQRGNQERDHLGSGRNPVQLVACQRVATDGVDQRNAPGDPLQRAPQIVGQHRHVARRHRQTPGLECRIEDAHRASPHLTSVPALGSVKVKTCG